MNLCECLRIGRECLRICVYFIADLCICPRICAYLCELARVLPRICRECGDPTAYFRELVRTSRIRVFAVYPRISTYICGVSAVYPCILVRVSSAYLPYIRREPVRNIRVFAYELGHVSPTDWTVPAICATLGAVNRLINILVSLRLVIPDHAVLPG